MLQRPARKRSLAKNAIAPNQRGLPTNSKINLFQMLFIELRFINLRQRCCYFIIAHANLIHRRTQKEVLIISLANRTAISLSQCNEIGLSTLHYHSVWEGFGDGISSWLKSINLRRPTLASGIFISKGNERPIQNSQSSYVLVNIVSILM